MTEQVLPNNVRPSELPGKSCPPNHLPPDVKKGYGRAFSKISAGLLVSNDDGRRWFKEKYGIELADHHRQDVNVPLCLGDVVVETGIAKGCMFADPPKGGYWWDFLVITQVHRGYWMTDSPDCCQEVLMEDVKPIETAYEEEVKKRLESELGIKTYGFKSYFVEG